ncbi:hypothetical protein R80B4_02075 [Fibrobacteres bacterium R8-0-B4]
MITMATEKRVINERDAKAEFDGRWLLLDERDFPPAEDTGYIVAYSDGTPETEKEDCIALHKIKMDVYHGNAILMKGFVHTDETYDNGIIEVL